MDCAHVVLGLSLPFDTVNMYICLKVHFMTQQGVMFYSYTPYVVL